ncbi:hypothetical protein [Parabacteroides sp.]
MDINSRIDWKYGLELTPDIFIALDGNLDARLQAVTRIMGLGVFGLIPNSQFACTAVFVRKNVEIERLRCHALLANGDLLDIDEDVVVSMPLLFGNEYYLTVKMDAERMESSEKNVSILKPKYIYGINTLEEVERNGNMFPLIKFNVDESVFSIEKEYIPACIQLSSHMGFTEYIAFLTSKLGEIAQHKNFESGEGQRTFIRYAFELQGYKLSNKVRDFAELMREIVLAIEYYIFKPNNQLSDIDLNYSLYDIRKWMSSVKEYLEGAIAVLDRVVLVDNTIDLEVLKAEIKKELHDEIYALLYDRVYEEMTGNIKTKIHDDIKEAVVEYIHVDLKRVLKNELDIEISDKLQKALFQDLYDRLYEALYVKPEEEQQFLPLI